MFLSRPACSTPSRQVGLQLPCFEVLCVRADSSSGSAPSLSTRPVTPGERKFPRGGPPFGGDVTKGQKRAPVRISRVPAARWNQRPVEKEATMSLCCLEAELQPLFKGDGCCNQELSQVTRFLVMRRFNNGWPGSLAILTGCDSN